MIALIFFHRIALGKKELMGHLKHNFFLISGYLLKICVLFYRIQIIILT